MNETYPINENAYSEWREFRNTELKKKIGPIAEKKQRQMLANYPPHIQQHIIDTSIRAGWQGLFPPKGIQQHQKASAASLAAHGAPARTRDRSLAHDLSDRSWIE